MRTYNVCFLGRTGNGKSSLINSLLGTELPTDGLVSCTKHLHSVTLITNEINGFDAISVYDTPGIGEFSSNSKYQKYYEYAVGIADCVVLVTTLDRTDAPAQRLLMNLKKDLKSDNVKFIIALNHIDSRIVADEENKYVPWNDDENIPSEECIKNIEERIQILHEKFTDKFLPYKIIPVCAKRDYNIVELKNNIFQ